MKKGEESAHAHARLRQRERQGERQRERQRERQGDTEREMETEENRKGGCVIERERGKGVESEPGPRSYQQSKDPAADHPARIRVCDEMHTAV